METINKASEVAMEVAYRSSGKPLKKCWGCGKVLLNDSTKTRCPECSRKHTEEMKRLCDFRKANGLCKKCGSKLPEGWTKVSCPRCNEKDNERHRKNSANKRKEMQTNSETLRLPMDDSIQSNESTEKESMITNNVTARQPDESKEEVLEETPQESSATEGITSLVALTNEELAEQCKLWDETKVMSVLALIRAERKTAERKFKKIEEQLANVLTEQKDCAIYMERLKTIVHVVADC